MREDVMWTWDYELRTLGSWPSERYNGHNMPVEVVTKADHDAALRRAKAEALREMKTALTSQSGTSAWDVVSYIEARIVELEREK